MSREILKFGLGVIAVLAVIVAILKVFFVDVVIVYDDRMAPTMIAGERVLMWRAGTPHIGDIAVCAHPTSPGEFVIGRVMGDASSPLTALRGEVAVAGRTPDRNWLGSFDYVEPNSDRGVEHRYGTEVIDGQDHEFMTRMRFVFATREVRILPGHVFLLNDQRSLTTLDSRSFGAVDAATCIGTIFMRLQPAEGRQSEPPFDHGYLDILH